MMHSMPADSDGSMDSQNRLEDRSLSFSACLFPERGELLLSPVVRVTEMKPRPAAENRKSDWS